MKIYIKDIFYRDQDLIIITNNDEEYIFHNAYPVDIRFETLD